MATSIVSKSFTNKITTISGINGLSATTTNLYTVPTGKKAVVTGITVRITTATGLTGSITLGVGVASGEDDIMPSTLLTGFDTTTEAFEWFADGTVYLASAGDVIKLGIDTAFGGTTVTLAVDLMGYIY